MGEGEEGDFPPKKIQSDAAEGSGGAVAALSDAPTMKKLARQLDFGGASGSVVLPEHSQSQPVLSGQPVAMPQPMVQSQPQPPQVVAVPVSSQPSVPSAKMV